MPYLEPLPRPFRELWYVVVTFRQWGNMIGPDNGPELHVAFVRRATAVLTHLGFLALNNTGDIEMATKICTWPATPIQVGPALNGFDCPGIAPSRMS